jgi:hypothetical protein
VVVEDLVAVLVEGGAEVSLSDGKTDGVGETLTEGTGGDLDTLSNAELGVTGGDGVELTELFVGRKRENQKKEE